MPAPRHCKALSGLVQVLVEARTDVMGERTKIDGLRRLAAYFVRNSKFEAVAAMMLGVLAATADSPEQSELADSLLRSFVAALSANAHLLERFRTAVHESGCFSGDEKVRLCVAGVPIETAVDGRCVASVDV